MCCVTNIYNMEISKPVVWRHQFLLGKKSVKNGRKSHNYADKMDCWMGYVQKMWKYRPRWLRIITLHYILMEMMRNGIYIYIYIATHSVGFKNMSRTGKIFEHSLRKKNRNIQFTTHQQVIRYSTPLKNSFPLPTDFIQNPSKPSINVWLDPL